MSLSVLIVDDSPLMRNLIRRIVTLAGTELVQCHEASDGQRALEQLARVPVDLILTDINMPGMDGEQLLRELNRRGVTTPAIVISTDATHSRMQRMLAMGAAGYVCKPFSPEAMRAELDRVLTQTKTGEPA